MARKKKSEMSPKERMEYILDGATWDDAEETGIEILARCMALHVYARKDGMEFFNALMEKIAKRADKWAHEEGNTTYLAIAAVGHKLQLRENNKNN